MVLRVLLWYVRNANTAAEISCSEIAGRDLSLGAYHTTVTWVVVVNVYEKKKKESFFSKKYFTYHI